MNIYTDDDVDMLFNCPESKKVDFLWYLGEKSDHSPVVSKILGYCGASDLENICRVSRSWQRVCLRDKVSLCRIKRHMAIQRTMKENHNEATHSNMSFNTIQRRNESTPKKRRPLSCWNDNFNFTIKKVTPGSPPVSPQRMKFIKFMKEAKKLGKNGRLVPCPKCTFPSKVNEEEGSGLCTQSSCAFYSCLRCQCSYHKGTDCKYFITLSPSSSPSKVVHHVVGSRQSRKALRKL